MAQTKFEKLRQAVEQDTAWSNGSEHPWEGDALVTPWLLEQLCLLAAHAPNSEINWLIRRLNED